MKIQIVILNSLGEFRSDIMDVTPDQYDIILAKSKVYYETGFEMLIDNNYVIMSPDIIKKSILKIINLDVQE